MGAMALAAGMLLALLFGNPWVGLTRRATHRLLAVAVVGLGAGMDLRVVAAAGVRGFGYTAAGIAGCLLLGRWLRGRLGVSPHLGLLITAGTAICGGSAIAAVVPVLRAEEREVSVALATVFLLNAAALVAFPFIGHLMALTPGQFGLWSALAIHDTSSVVAAALAYGGNAVEIATTVKLGRALWIVPLTLVLAMRQSGSAAGMKRPWFILGFLVAAALGTWVRELRPVLPLVVGAARGALVLTLFLIGAGLTRATVRSVGLRPLLLGAILWITTAGWTLAAIAGHVIGDR